jgi:hypothetical protein
VAHAFVTTRGTRLYFAMLRVIVEVPQVARIAGMLAERAREADKVAQVHVAVTVSLLTDRLRPEPRREPHQEKAFFVHSAR